ncbi:ATP-binding protein [Epilithonimonas xixisoli]|uniref:AAA domain-containing protein n=1 Tax=Epilithonimonas xixisoli TaxID=1476462 RepID=A0A4R8I6G0_9FLAO|nr:ATP-binding protein [Epilithonimonas xixisoli]TDX83945.1 AAA domain-containing protein [Epilithonimonas xixisoli]
MKNVFLKSLKLYFFKGTKKREVIFKDHQTDIAGPNGSGKTTLFDAFTWLLFGKDSHDRKDFNIKTLESSGKNIEKTEHTVQGVLSVDGKDYDLRRVYKENWVKTRGELELTLKGHETLFYINEVPRKATEYAHEIGELIDESLFKLITNPRYFANLNWTKQREILFSMSGDVENDFLLDKISTIQNKTEIGGLINILNSGKDLEKYKLELRDKKKKLKEDLDKIPTRVDEAENSKPEEADFAKTEETIKFLADRVGKIDEALESASSAFSEKHNSNQSVLSEINTLRSKQQQVVFDANTEARTKDFESKSGRRDNESKIKEAESRVRILKNSLASTQKAKEITLGKRDALREKYSTVDNSEFTQKDGQLTCPVFNIVCDSPKANELHKANADTARETFNKKKVEELETINQNGAELNQELANHEAEITNVNADIEKEETLIAGLKSQLDAFPADEPIKELTGEDVPAFTELQYQINILNKKIVEVKADDNSLLKEEKQNLLTEIDALKKILAGKDQIHRLNERIAELNETGRNLAQQIADLEKDEFAVDAFNKAKIEECESRINGKFSMVSFKLFNQQLNGGESETCEILINGVPYSDANTASQINAGLDVINVLSKFHGVTAPIFIDNRESVSNIIYTESQVINLLVTNDKELVIK